MALPVEQKLEAALRIARASAQQTRTVAAALEQARGVTGVLEEQAAPAVFSVFQPFFRDSRSVDQLFWRFADRGPSFFSDSRTVDKVSLRTLRIATRQFVHASRIAKKLGPRFANR